MEWAWSGNVWNTVEECWTGIMKGHTERVGDRERLVRGGNTTKQNLSQRYTKRHQATKPSKPTNIQVPPTHVGWFSDVSERVGGLTVGHTR